MGLPEVSFDVALATMWLALAGERRPVEGITAGLPRELTVGEGIALREAMVIFAITSDLQTRT